MTLNKRPIKGRSKERVNYYPHHIGDYARDTAHLSMLEDAAYRRMLDLYYASERPLPKNKDGLYRLVRAKSSAEKSSVDVILGEFFTETETGWRNARADLEIESWRSKSSKARSSAAHRWQSDGSANAMRTHSDGNANQNQNQNQSHNQNQREERSASASSVDKSSSKPNGSGAWWKTEEGIKAKGEELKIPPNAGESWQAYKDRLFQKIGTRA